MDCLQCPLVDARVGHTDELARSREWDLSSREQGLVPFLPWPWPWIIIPFIIFFKRPYVALAIRGGVAIAERIRT